MSEKEKFDKLYSQWLASEPAKKFGTTCKEYDEFVSWLPQQLPSLFSTTTAAGYSHKGIRFFIPEEPPGRAPADHVNVGILRVSKEYARRCEAMSSSHECKADFCIHRVFHYAIQELVAMTKWHASEMTRRTLEREKLVDKDEAETARRREVKALREKLEATEKALHEKGQQLESVKWTVREVFGISATPQGSSDAPTPSRDDVPTSKPWGFERSPGGAPPYSGGQYPTPMAPESPRTRREQYQEEQESDRIKGQRGGD